MAVKSFPVEASHIMMFARSINDANPIYHDAEHAKKTEPGKIIAPPTFVQASAQFDPDYFLRPKVGQPWFGSGKNATGITRAPGGGVHHAVTAAPGPGRGVKPVVAGPEEEPDQQAAQRPQEPQQRRLGQQKPDQLTRARTERQTNRHFRRASGDLRQQNVRNVGARNRQHDDDERGEEYEEGGDRPRVAGHGR